MTTLDEKRAARKALLQSLRDRRDRKFAIREVPEVKSLQIFLAGATSADIDAYYDANTKTPVDQATLLKTVLKLLAHRLPSLG